MGFFYKKPKHCYIIITEKGNPVKLFYNPIVAEWVLDLHRTLDPIRCQEWRIVKWHIH